MGGVSVGGTVGVRVRVGGGGGVCVLDGVRVCVREGGMNSVSVGVGDWTAEGAVVWTGGGWRRVEVACTPGLGVSSMVGVGWMAIRTTAVQ
jgi:hypothetical protein